MVVGALRDLRRPAVDGRARQVECRFYVHGAMRMMSAAAVGRAPFHAPFGHLRAASRTASHEQKVQTPHENRHAADLLVSAAEAGRLTSQARSLNPQLILPQRALLATSLREIS